MRRLALVALVAGLALALPSGVAAVSPTVRLTIMHLVQNCHVWRNAKAVLGPNTKVTVKPGTRLVLRSDCPMDFDLAQTKGPKLALGDPRMYAGQSRTIVFRKAGTYRLTAKNVQTPEERGLQTLGPANTLVLTVVVR
ncbi:MAG: cupredoxin domain-containing protein [Gaiellaceae bacterium]